MDPFNTDVLVVGAGPTGLALATSLQKAGVDYVLIDVLEGAHNTSRAAVIHAHTLEMLDAIDVADAMAREGIPISNFVIRDRDHALLTVSFGQLPSPFQHLLMLPQSTTESVLLERLEELGGGVHRGIAAIDAETDEGGAVVRLRAATGETSIRARYIVGADGMHSVIRQAAGIAFEGEAYGESFVLADVEMDWPLGDEVSLFFSPQGLVVVAPLPGGSYRIVATLDDAPEQPDIADMQRLIATRGPTQPCRISALVWSSRFRIHHRLAETYRKGPLLLMGDAAHVHSPAGGQGMNTGLVDAVVLGEALARVIRDREPDAVLDDYCRVRRPAAEGVLALASRLTRIATLRSAPARSLRNVALRLVDRLPHLKRKIAFGLSGLARRRFAVLPASPAHRDRARHGQPAPIARQHAA